jgi:RNA-directed DNA polymerase
MLRANVTTSSRTDITWRTIEWRQVYRTMNNLRRRIYRASAEGDLKRVRSLQKLMLYSKANKLAAIRQVTQQNQGKHTPGVDKIVIRTDKAREQLYRQLQDYAPEQGLPVKRRHIPKQTGKRPLGIPTILDRCQQAIVKQALEPYWEAKFEATSYGFRPGRSAHDAIEKIFCIANPSNTRRWVLDADIQGAFDHINHDFLLKQIKGFPGSGWVKQWLTAGVMIGHQWQATTMGAPQGGLISPLLLNITLHGMEEAIGVQCDNKGYLKRDGPALVRYADDFVVLHRTSQGCEAARQALQSWLAPRGLMLSKPKTHIRHLTQGFDFLGFHIRHYRVSHRKNPYVILMKPAKASIKSFREQLKVAWKQAVAWPTAQTIDFLNAKIRGWCHYFRIGAAKQTFAALDHWMWSRQVRFAHRRHPGKSWKWKGKTYWGTIPGRQDRWVFQDKVSGKHLLKLAWFPIQRHTLVKGNASPDDPKLKEYWKQRQTQKVKTLSNSRIRITLWRRQLGKCLICEQPLDNHEEVHLHHIVPKHQGGSNRVDNLCLLHATCHRQVHSKHTSASVRSLLEPDAG